MRRLLVALLVVSLVAPAAAVPVVTPVVVTITVKRGKVVGGTKRPTVTKGRTVRFVIRTDAGESVHLHGYEISRVVRPGRVLTIQFVTRLRGRFELELHHPDVLLADLTVR